MSLIEEDTDEAMKLLASILDEFLNEDLVLKKYGFSLLVFPFDESDKTANFISNVKREYMIKALREQADVLEKKLDIPAADAECLKH